MRADPPNVQICPKTFVHDCASPKGALLSSGHFSSFIREQDITVERSNITTVQRKESGDFALSQAAISFLGKISNLVRKSFDVVCDRRSSKM